MPVRQQQPRHLCAIVSELTGRAKASSRDEIPDKPNLKAANSATGYHTELLQKILMQSPAATWKSLANEVERYVESVLASV